MTADSKGLYRKSSRNRTRSALTTGMAALFLALTLILAPVATTPALAGSAGSFAKALKDRFCSGTSGASFYGCYAYMYYRVDYNRSRDTAKSNCYQYGCGGKYGNGTPNYETCKTGCDHAYAADTK